MLIKNLPKPIKELVFKRLIEQENPPNDELPLLRGRKQGNFEWGNTQEAELFWNQIYDGNYKPFFEKYGCVILCTSVEQGAKIIDYFKSLGVNTKHYKGYALKIYYGVINNDFGHFSTDYVIRHNIPIFTLDELGVETAREQPQQPELPEINFEGIEMEVWDDIWDEDENVVYCKGKVIAKVKGRYLLDDWTFWDNARPIQQKVKVTKEQIAEVFNTTVELLEIE